MNKKTQQIVGSLAILGLGYWAYTKYGKKKSFANLTATAPQGCEFKSGNVSQSYVGKIVNGNQVIISTGNGQTLLCPIGQRFTMPTK